ncbi:formimidoylglutamate deiminase [Streptomyces sp. 3MP-14]|uniref:Formimidoylglutamate deiminase n=1 Tax=Streptomyces mimosae TaxID=2586635 RepID=A0A5N5ZXQ1_9ACTN|nr:MULTISPECIES: formimidoylglutamate deiminase [Streptomyces]KAB8160160.1 formimidoylglutamate deiminase [Streptomyces mimosae]KAB8176671.1 formimidoylglutamate deiminase [Streptomyces sp. 3MP-14]
MSLTAQTYWTEHAWLNGTVEPGVVIATALDGSITEVRPGVDEPPIGAVSLRGLTVPGLANVHSHAFHRALRSTAQVGGGTFWTWRNAMYDLSLLLDPDGYYALARAVYAEMALAGITCVGEFHYVHHQPDGTPYHEPNAMAEALIAAAGEAGIRITLLDTCYLSAGFGRPPDRHQRRFSDGTVDAWAERADALRATDLARIGAAVHSVRAVPAEALATVADWAARHGAPLHVHLSEQPGENEECLAAHGRSPTQLLADHGVLTRRTTAVHATHLEEADVALLGAAGTGACLCPTTERDLADGIGPAVRLRDAGCPLSLGSDSHAVIDLFEEARAVELGERVRTHARGHFTADQLLRCATENGHAALGWPEAGRLETGALADFTTVSLDTVRTAGPPPRLAAEAVIFAATGADVRHTVVGGRHIVRHGSHQLVHDAPRALRRAIAALHARR